MAGKKSYKTLLIQARELQQEAGKNAYRRASLLVSVFGDRDFRTESGALEDNAAAALLDGYTEDLCLGFDELRAMLAAFPDESRWADGKLASLWDETLELAKATAKANREEPSITRNRVTKKDVEELKEQKRSAEIALKRAESEVANKTSEADQLRARIRDLELENSQLRGRIEQLEKSMTAAVR